MRVYEQTRGHQKQVISPRRNVGFLSSLGSKRLSHWVNWGLSRLFPKIRSVATRHAAINRTKQRLTPCIFHAFVLWHLRNAGSMKTLLSPTLEQDIRCSISFRNQLNVPCWLYVVIVLFIFKRDTPEEQDKQTHITRRKRKRTSPLILSFHFSSIALLCCQPNTKPHPS